jgi:hypothetical protein
VLPETAATGSRGDTHQRCPVASQERWLQRKHGGDHGRDNCASWTRPGARFGAGWSRRECGNAQFKSVASRMTQIVGHIANASGRHDATASPVAFPVWLKVSDLGCLVLENTACDLDHALSLLQQPHPVDVVITRVVEVGVIKAVDLPHHRSH